MTLKVTEEEKEATVKLSLMSGGGGLLLEASGLPLPRTHQLLPLYQTGSVGNCLQKSLSACTPRSQAVRTSPTFSRHTFSLRMASIHSI